MTRRDQREPQACRVDDCDQEAVADGRCRKHRLVPPRTARFGYDRDRLTGTARIFPGGLDSVRTRLVESLAAAVGDDRANDIADALDAYLATDPADRLPPFQWTPPNHEAELDEAIKQRDEAIARAEKAERQMKKRPKGKKV